MEEKSLTPLDMLRADYEARPDDIHAAARLAEHYADLGWFNEALDVYRDALTKNADDLSLLIGYGNTCFRHHDLGEALKAFRRLTETRPERIEGWNNLGIVFMAKGDDDAARTAFGRVLAIESDNAGTLLNMGNCHARKGNTAEARGFFERAIAVKPDYADGWFNLGNACLAEKDFQNAKAAFEKALKYQREFPSALKNLGYVHEQCSDWTSAVGCYRQAALLDRADAGIQINLANACMALELFEEARTCFLKAVKLAAKNTAGWMGLRHIALMKGDVPTYMRATIAILPHLSESAIAKTVEILLGLRHLREAKEIVVCADRCGKQSAELDAQRLLVYRLCSVDQPQQVLLYKKGCALQDAPDTVKKALAKYAFECRDFDAAKSHALAMKEIDPAARAILARSHIELGEKKEARELLARYAAEQPHNGEMLFLLACSELEEGDADQARKDFLLALENGFSAVEEINRYPAFKLLFERLGSGKNATA